ncbi:unnamed protein product [Fusarium equiseti]|uniref:Uncharacterized protein n=1 Tax=Fusarium equiseti TaxID=61235 RepID=A0A8J2N784_FUSEQ|nr:unnamed protein product [Fusarium equiseti]
MPVTEIRDYAHFKELIENNHVVIIDAWAKSHELRVGMSSLFHDLSENPQSNRSGLVFAKHDLDNDKNEDVSHELDTPGVPAFVTYCNGYKVDSLIIMVTDPEKLEELVEEAISLPKWG